MPSDLYRSLTEHVPLMEEALKEADEMWKQIEGIGDPNMVALYSRTYTITEELLHLYNTQRETLETETVEGRTLDDELLDLEDTAEQIENLLLEILLAHHTNSIHHGFVTLIKGIIGPHKGIIGPHKGNNRENNTPK